jgi:hypothetical protein
MQTGNIIVFYGESEEEELEHQVVKSKTQRYIKVKPASSRNQYKWMEKFVSTLNDESLQERLLIAIDGKGAFRRFKDILVHFPGIRERWYNYRSVHLHNHINDWLTSIDLMEKVEIPPWGLDVDVPEDDPRRPEEVTSDMSPAEILRSQAKEIIDLIPAIDLPAAISFLTYLKDKGSNSLFPKD